MSKYGFLLTNPISTIRGLVFYRRVPPAIKMYNMVGPGPGYAHAASF
jgi:hypothetical protein